jgi:hypothetical protein
LLQSVPKSEVLDPLSAEPLTLHYYHDFRRCTGCGRIYWPGTHIDKLAARLARVTGECLGNFERRKIAGELFDQNHAQNVIVPGRMTPRLGAGGATLDCSKSIPRA